MLGTPARLPQLRSLSSARPSRPGGEPAGPGGGDRPGPGTRALPLVSGDEESRPPAVALREAGLSGILGSDQATPPALLKLRHGLLRGTPQLTETNKEA